MNVPLLLTITSLLFCSVIRTKVLESVDTMLSFVFQNLGYQLVDPIQGQKYQNESSELIFFAREYGYFSKERPIIGKVTDSQEDTDLTIEMLRVVHQTIRSQKERLIATGELLTKVLAYRNLQKGQRIPVPTLDESFSPILTWYVVDEVFDLWNGMPAFGLVPEEKSGSSILLFRGTDLSLLTRRGLSSVLSDIDIEGVGVTVFYRSQAMIDEWLKKMSQEGMKSSVMGFSQGGTLAALTLLYEQKYIDSAIAFNPAGISLKVFNKYLPLQESKIPPFLVFVTRGDPVSKKGLLFGEVYECVLEEPLYPIASHVALISGETSYQLFKVDVKKENACR